MTEIWEENGLKHLRDAATPFQHEEVFTYDPGKGTYAFQEGYEVTEEDAFVFIDQRDHDELANQLMQIQPAKEEPKPPVPSSTEETSQSCKQMHRVSAKPSFGYIHTMQSCKLQLIIILQMSQSLKRWLAG